MSEPQSSLIPSTRSQKFPVQEIFVVGLLLLAFAIAWFVVARVDPRAAQPARSPHAPIAAEGRAS